MRALLLAAGYGTRLRPLTDSVPKCLVPIRGRPLLDYWLEMLTQGGIERVVVNLHYLPEQVIRYVASSLFRDRVSLVYEDELVGTGGSILQHAEHLGDGPVLVAHADNLTRMDVRAFMERHRERPARCELTMMTFETDSPQSCGIVELDAEGVVTGFREKPRHSASRLANGAVYVLEPSVIEFLRASGKRSIDFSTEVVPAYVGRIFTFHNQCYHRDIGTPESYARAQLDNGFEFGRS